MTGLSQTISAPELSQAQRRRRLTLALIVGCAAVLALVNESLWHPGGPIHEIIEFTGLAFIVVAIVGRTWCTIYIGGRKKHVLVADGPYSLCRNPLYVFSIFGVTGIGLATGSIMVGLILGLAFWFVFDRIVRREEVYLAEHHGAAFAEYAAHVPRWRPNFAGWSDVESLEAQPERIVVTFREAALMLIALPLLELVEWAQDSGWLPVLLHLP
jgi:protein-S-isoprenylcysteine O-methyltransferase Ste14